MAIWSALPGFVRTRPVLAAGVASLALLALLGGGVMVVASHDADAYASIPAAPALRPAVRTDLAPPPPISPLPAVLEMQNLTPDQALAANQAIPMATLPNPAAKPFSMADAADEDKARAETCLAQAVYYEAGFEPLEGEQAVAQVVLNRVRHPVYPKTVCGVVFQGAELKTGCQFTFTCDGALGRTPEEKAWARAVTVAHAALNGYVMKPVGEATHYHTQYVVPYWSPSLVKLTQIGQHIFYRWTGTFGQPPAFGGQYAGNEPGTATEVAAVSPLIPLQKLAVDFSAAASATTTGGSDRAGAATGSAADAANPPAALDGKADDSRPVVLAQAAIAPVEAVAPAAIPIKKAFVPAQSLLPRPKWKAF